MQASTKCHLTPSASPPPAYAAGRKGSRYEAEDATIVVGETIYHHYIANSITGVISRFKNGHIPPPTSITTLYVIPHQNNRSHAEMTPTPRHRVRDGINIPTAIASSSPATAALAAPTSPGRQRRQYRAHQSPVRADRIRWWITGHHIEGETPRGRRILSQVYARYRSGE